MKQRRLAWWLAIILVAAAGSGWIYVSRAPQSEFVAAGPAARVRFRAPDFARPRLDGSDIALGDLSGTVVLLNFWATWCMPCRVEIPELESVYQAHRAQGFTVLAINAQEEGEPVAAFVKQYQVDLPVLLDRDGAVLRLYQVQALPTSFLIDRTGIVRATHMGSISRAYLEAEIAPLLEAAR